MSKLYVSLRVLSYRSIQLLLACCFVVLCVSGCDRSPLPKAGDSGEQPEGQISLSPGSTGGSLSAVEAPDPRDTEGAAEEAPLLVVDFEQEVEIVNRNLLRTSDRARTGSFSGVMQARGDVQYMLTEVGNKILFGAFEQFSVSLWIHADSLANVAVSVRVVYYDDSGTVVDQARLADQISPPIGEWAQQVLTSTLPIPVDASYGKVQFGLRTVDSSGFVTGSVYFDDIAVVGVE